MARLQRLADGMVFRSQYDSVLDDLKASALEIERLRRALGLSVPSATARLAEEEAALARAETEALRRRLDGAVPREEADRLAEDLERARMALAERVERPQLVASQELCLRLAEELDRASERARGSVPRDQADAALCAARGAAAEAARLAGVLGDAETALREAVAELSRQHVVSEAASRAARAAVTECAGEVDSLACEMARVRATAARMVPEAAHGAVVDELRRALSAIRRLERAAQGMVPAAALGEAEDRARLLSQELERTKVRLQELMDQEDLARSASEMEKMQLNLGRLRKQRGEALELERELREELGVVTADARRLQFGLSNSVPKHKCEAALEEAKLLAEEIEQLRARMTGMVPRQDKDKAESEIKLLKEDLYLLQQSLANRDEWIKSLREEVKQLRGVVEAKSEELMQTVPRSLAVEVETAVKDGRRIAEDLLGAIRSVERELLDLQGIKHSARPMDEDITEGLGDPAHAVQKCRIERGLDASDIVNIADSLLLSRIVVACQQSQATVLRIQLLARNVVPKSEYVKAKDELSRQQQESLALSQEISNLKILLRTYLNLYTTEVELLSCDIVRIEARVKGMVPAIQYNELHDYAQLISGELHCMKREMRSMVAQSRLEEANNRILSLQEECQSLKENMQSMVTKTAFDMVQSQLESDRCESTRMKDFIARSVSKTLFNSAQDEITECRAEITRLQRSKDSMVSKAIFSGVEDELANSKIEIETLQQTISSMVPRKEVSRFEHSINLLSSQLAASNEDSAQKQVEIQFLKSEIKSLQKELDRNAKELLDCCPRQDVMNLRSEMIKSRDAAENVQNENERLAILVSRMSQQFSNMVHKQEYLNLQDDAARIREGLADLRQILTSAGLCDYNLLTRFASALKGHQSDTLLQVCRLLETLKSQKQVTIYEICEFVSGLNESGSGLLSDLMALLKELQSPHQRTITELRHIVQIVNHPFPMCAEDLIRMRTLLRGTSTEVIDGLQKIIEEGCTIEGFQSLRDDIASCRRQLLESDEEIKNLRSRNDLLIQDVSALKVPHAPVCTAPYSTTFSEYLVLSLVTCDSNAVIYYTTDGNMPGPDCFEGVGTGSSSLEVILTRSCVLKAVCAASSDGRGMGKVMTKKFMKKDEKKRDREKIVNESALSMDNTNRAAIERRPSTDRKRTTGSEGISPGKPTAIDKIGGVGMLIERYEDRDNSQIVVKSLIKGGAAEQDGRVRPGDFLLAVDGKEVRDAKVESVSKLISGTEGSKVELLLTRQGEEGSKIRVNLTRSSSGYMTT